MNCEQVRGLLDGYVDHELQPVAATEAGTHLSRCHACSHAYQERQGLSLAVRRHAVRCYPTPAGLRDRILRSLGAPEQARAWPSFALRRWLPLGGAVAFAIAAASGLTLYLATPSDQDRLTDGAISAHLRSLQANHLTDIASADPYALQAWFHARGEVVPAVKDLSTAGFRLLGGRLDYLYKRQVATVVYQSNGHTINLYVWHLEDDKPVAVTALSDEGFNLLLWGSGGMNYCAISDAAPSDLMTFAQSFKSASN